MAESIYTTQTPATEDSDFDIPSQLGVQFTVAVGGQITGGRYWRPTNTMPATAKWQLWRVSDQAKLAEFDMTGLASVAGWNTFSITPVSVVTAESYVVCSYTVGGSGRIVYTTGATYPLTNGNLTASTGRFKNGGTAADFPDGTEATYFFADVQFTASGGGATVAPDGIAVPVSLGAPALSWSGSVAPGGISVPVALGAPTVGAVGVAPDGISVPVALGSPSLAWTGSIAPDGISVPVTVGAPTVGAAGLTPDGIGVPVTLGAPALTWSGGVSPDGITVPVTLGSPSIPGALLAPDGVAVPVTLGAPDVAWSWSVSPDGIPVVMALGAPTLSVSGGIIPRPNTGTITRPNTGVIIRTLAGVIARLSTGIILRP